MEVLPGRVEEFVRFCCPFNQSFEIQPLPADSYTLLIETAELALILYLPQLALSLFGGLVAFLLTSLTQIFRRRPALQPAPG